MKIKRRRKKKKKKKEEEERILAKTIVSQLKAVSLNKKNKERILAKTIVSQLEAVSLIIFQSRTITELKNTAFKMKVLTFGIDW